MTDLIKRLPKIKRQWKPCVSNSPFHGSNSSRDVKQPKEERDSREKYQQMTQVSGRKLNQSTMNFQGLTNQIDGFRGEENVRLASSPAKILSVSRELFLAGTDQIG